jgi:hypothetical protein
MLREQVRGNTGLARSVRGLCGGRMSVILPGNISLKLFSTKIDTI